MKNVSLVNVKLHFHLYFRIDIDGKTTQFALRNQ